MLHEHKELGQQKRLLGQTRRLVRVRQGELCQGRQHTVHRVDGLLVRLLPLVHPFLCPAVPRGRGRIHQPTPPQGRQSAGRWRIRGLGDSRRRGVCRGPRAGCTPHLRRERRRPRHKRGMQELQQQRGATEHAERLPGAVRLFGRPAPLDAKHLTELLHHVRERCHVRVGTDDRALPKEPLQSLADPQQPVARSVVLLKKCIRQVLRDEQPREPILTGAEVLQDTPAGIHGAHLT
mmetsp:Transcript_21166/g.61787  ORF Transcript_21166/g.61787 Transcript_21166/m.61787 type:complete len:235 (-) Transcript_21166:87-791(-)